MEVAEWEKSVSGFGEIIIKVDKQDGRLTGGFKEELWWKICEMF